MKRAIQTFSKLLLCAVLLLAATTDSAQAWWNGEWTMRRKITIDTSDKGVVIADAAGTPAVLIRLHDGNFQFAGAKEDGSDIRFVAADEKTLLPYHIEKYDSLMSEAFVWVKVPDLKPDAANTLWLYYGNIEKAKKVDDAKATYDGDAVLVYHFAERGQPAHDSTAQANHAQNAGVAVDGSMIGGGVRFDGKSAITLPDSASLAWSDGGAMSWSAWVKLSSLQPNAVIFSRRDGNKSFLIGADNGIPFVEVNGQRSPAGAPVTANSWHNLAVVADAGKVTVYLDGESYATLSAALPGLKTTALLGGDNVTSGGKASVAGFAGELDELQLARVARPVGVIKLAAFSQGSEKAGKLMTFSPEEKQESWFSGGHFGIILQSLTLDAWIVIFVLMILSGISWYVMISKVMYLNSLGRGNELFMNEWQHVASDLNVLDHGDPEQVKTLGGRVNKKDVQRAIRSSSVYRIFHIGAEQVRIRMAADRSGARVLTAESIAAIRASLDTGLVRESQKLNSWVVVLTIAISGGPFLGLLGTVVGVMITFAEIAAAGDVNVNAIAPGIAAALVATVAGLAVAIPALFGYNYILSRVKDATSDMQVFVDEFISRLAEFYSSQPDNTPVVENEGDLYAGTR